MAEEDAENLGQGEHELPVRQPQQQVLVHVFAQQEGPLLGAGGTEVEDTATEGPEVLVSTTRIGTLDPREAPAVVTAVQEPPDGLRDAL